MTVYLYPADAVSGAPQYTAETWRLLANGVLGPKTAARPLGARSGLWPGTDPSSISISGSTITIGPLGGVLDVETPADAGPYCFAVDPAETRTLTAASASNQRVDSIFVSMNDPAESDGSSVPAATITYTAGLAGAAGGSRGAAGGPPAIPVRSIELAQIVVPKSGTGSPSITWVAPYTVAAGGILPTSGSAVYPAAPFVGQYVDDSSLGLMRWTGSVWDQQKLPVSRGQKDMGTLPGTGLLTITHTLGVTPTFVQLTTERGTAFGIHAQVYSRSSANIVVQLIRIDTAAVLTGAFSGSYVYWEVRP